MAADRTPAEDLGALVPFAEFGEPNPRGADNGRCVRAGTISRSTVG